MSEPTPINDLILTEAAKARAVMVDGVQVTRRGLDELAKADQHLKAQDAASKKGFGLRFQQIVPGGCG
jgi:hypothetical protein